LHQDEKHLLDAISAGLDMDEYLLWISRGIPHNDQMELQARDEYEECESWVELRLEIAIEELCEGLDMDVDFDDYCYARKYLSHEEVVELIRYPGHVGTYVEARRAGVREDLAGVFAVEAMTLQSPWDYWTLIDECESVEEMQDVSEGKCDPYVYLTFRAEGLDHDLALARAIDDKARNW